MPGNTLRRLGIDTLLLAGQWMLGAVFLFSGFVKAADPLGMEHKLEAYFRAMDIDLGAFGIPLVAGSATLDIITVLIALVEFLFGMYYVLGMHQRLTAVFGTLFMAFMTSVTLWIYLYDPVPDCGCFGDAIVLTNAQTLAKNIVLLAVAILLLVYRRHMVRCISRRNEWFATSTSFLYILALSIYSIRMLPILDFTGYKEGTDLHTALYGEYRTCYVYEKEGEQRTFHDGETLPDSTWKLLSAESEEVVPPQIADFSITDAGGNDIGAEIIDDTAYTFLVTLPEITTADAGCSDLLNDVCDFAEDHGLAMWCATAVDEEGQQQWADRTGAAYPFATAAAETLKAMVRSNPGLMLIHEGRIIAKWGHHNIPDHEMLTVAGIQTLERYSQNFSTRKRYLLVTALYVGILLFVILSDRIWAGNRYYRRIRRARLWLQNNGENDTECPERGDTDTEERTEGQQLTAEGLPEKDHTETETTTNSTTL